eukprot:3459572-Amphidinium_carterae.1
MQTIRGHRADISISAARCHLMPGVDHKLVERVYSSMCKVVAAKVVQFQSNIVLNDTGECADCEADEVTFRRRRRAKESELWDRTATTIARATGPGLLRTEKWFEVERPLLEGRRVILHTNRAKVYASLFR